MALSTFSFAEAPAYLYFPFQRAKTQHRLLGLHNQWFTIATDLKFGFMSAGRDETYSFSSGEEGIFHTNQEASRFYFEEVLMTPRFFLKEPLKAIFQLRFLPDAISLKRGYILTHFTKNFFLQAGLENRFLSEINFNDRFFSAIYYETIVPPLITTAFGNDQDLQIAIGGDHSLFNEQNHFYWRASLSNGQRFAEASRANYVGKQKTYPILSDMRQLENFDTHKEVGLGLGFGNTFSPSSSLEFMVFSFLSKLNQRNPDLGRETDFLRNVIPGYFSPKRDRHRTGLHARFRSGFPAGSLSLWSQYIHALDGEVKRHLIAVEPSLSWSPSFFRSNLLQKIDFIYRWNFLYAKASGVTDDIPDSPFTWDRTTHTFAMNIHSVWFVSWKNEFHLNLEDTGSPHKEVKNNEFLSQMVFYF